MRVYGYTSNKVSVPVDLTIEQVVQSGIDPWRLDLFDPAPIQLPELNKDLFFRRLDDILFAYKPLYDERMFLAARDGDHEICVSGQYVTSGAYGQLTDTRPSERSFASHWQEYLELLEGPKCSAQINEPWFCTWEPQPSKRMFLDHDVLMFWNLATPCRPYLGSLQHWESGNFRPHKYVGEMFREIAVSVELAPQINWILDVLKPWNPKVVRDAIRRSLCSQPVESVELILPEEHLQSAAEALSRFVPVKVRYGLLALNGNRNRSYMLNFLYKNCRYLVEIPKGPGDEPCLSIDGMFSTRSNEVVGSRIAWHDLGATAARKVCAEWMREQEDIARIEAEGLTVANW